MGIGRGQAHTTPCLFGMPGIMLDYPHGPRRVGGIKQKSGRALMPDNLTRRGLLATAGALALAAPARAAGNEPVFDDSEPTRGVAIPSVQHMDEMAAAPLIQKKVNKLWNDSPTIKEPNALQ